MMDKTSRIIFLCLLITFQASAKWEEEDNEEFGEDELGTIPEDLSEYTKQGSLLYKTLWKPRHCDVATKDGDDVTMVMEYYGVREDGKHVEAVAHCISVRHALQSGMHCNPDGEIQGGQHHKARRQPAAPAVG